MLWDSAPHDLSIIDYLLGRMPRSVAAMGVSHTSSDLEDVAYLNLDFGNSLIATFHVNWLSPVKLRHTIIGGSKRASFITIWTRPAIQIYDSGFNSTRLRRPVDGVLVGYRAGDIWSPYIRGAKSRCKTSCGTLPSASSRIKRPLTDGEAGAARWCGFWKPPSEASRPKGAASRFEPPCQSPTASSLPPTSSFLSRRSSISMAAASGKERRSAPSSKFRKTPAWASGVKSHRIAFSAKV